MFGKKELTSLHPKYRPDIDGLRAIAVLGVIAFHAFPDYIKGGFIGVDVFFVISGYLISTIIFENLDKESFSFYEFYGRRIRRIFPALILVLVACVVFGWFALLADEYMRLGKQIAAGAGFVSNLVLWSEAGYFDSSADTKPLLHLWSLGIEEQFYILWPFTLWFVWKRKFFSSRALILIILIIVVSFILNIREVKLDLTSAFYSPVTRFWELLAGSLLAWIALYKTSVAINATNRLERFLVFLPAKVNKGRGSSLNALSNIISLIGAALLSCGFWLINKESSFPGYWALMPVVGTVLILAAGSQTWINRKILSNRVMVWIGLISYPLYLWHWPLLSFAKIVEDGTPSVLMRILLVLMSLILATITYLKVERPLRISQKNKITTISLSLAMFIVGIVGWSLHQFNGLESRNTLKHVGTISKAFEWPDELNWDRECLNEMTVTSKLEYCRHVVGNGQKIRVIGDSHANAIFPGLIKQLHGKNYDLLNFGAGGCSPLYDLLWKDQTMKSCLVATNRLYSFLAQPASDEIVILYPRAIYPSFSMVLSRNPELNDYNQILSYAIRNSLNKIIKPGRRIVFVVDVPELGFDTRECLDQRPLRITSKSIRTPCASARTRFENQSREYHAVINSVLADYPQVQRFDAWKYLCDDELCYGIKNNILLYRDSGHLSQDGGSYVAKMLARDILGIENPQDAVGTKSK